MSLYINFVEILKEIINMYFLYFSYLFLYSVNYLFPVLLTFVMKCLYVIPKRQS